MKALIVEDDKLLRRYISFLLKQFNCEITIEAGTGQEAVYLAEAEEPDFIFMDIVLNGEMDGIEAARIISAKSMVPIMFMSGYDVEYQVKNLSLPNMAGFLYKPVDEHSIRSAVIKITKILSMTKQMH